MFTGVVQNFMSFNAVGVIIAAMVGVASPGKGWSRRTSASW
jgi:p-aminobenzoyl-glutamate transporter AbgT